ncbi:MAG: hypothetical protein ABA06_01820 [Parcubacteria bacterium C7867-001]|nr:MAG: hypothetical protein ABA06_01820 [Parcubacteria bacterium C7867-001]
MPSVLEVIRRSLEQLEQEGKLAQVAPEEDAKDHKIEFLVAPVPSCYDQEQLKAFALQMIPLTTNSVFGFIQNSSVHFGELYFYGGNEPDSRRHISIRVFPSIAVARHVKQTGLGKAQMRTKFVADFQQREDREKKRKSPQ